VVVSSGHAGGAHVEPLHDGVSELEEGSGSSLVGDVAPVSELAGAMVPMSELESLVSEVPSTNVRVSDAGDVSAVEGESLVNVSVGLPDDAAFEGATAASEF
jgi:hypothetical protein